jgi:aconitate hydratase
MQDRSFTRNLELSDGTSYRAVDFSALNRASGGQAGRLPFSLRILLENLVRHLGHGATEAQVEAMLNWTPNAGEATEIPFFPARVLMQDFTGVPAVVDLAALRDAVRERGGDPAVVNPSIPVDLIIDHSVQVDCWGSPACLQENVQMEYRRNAERYRILKWASNSFDQFRVVPPNSGICHQVNLEHLAQVVRSDVRDSTPWAYLDSLLGTDSHTPMVNGIGVLAWGVGGIEAEAVTMGQPYMMQIPEVVGVRLTGQLPPNATATDLVLTLTQRLRETGVVGQFVEYFGPGIASLSVPHRATIANMTPENGSTVGIFPVDDRTLDYLRRTGRSEAARLTEAYTRELGLFDTANQDIAYSRTVDLALEDVRPCIAGPARPQDRIPLAETAGIGHAGPAKAASAAIEIRGQEAVIQDGSIVIAAITSCTNTSNPDVMIAAGLLARNAVEKGLSVPPYVKTSLAPGSRVVVDYLEASGLRAPLAALGFDAVAFGCTTCIGNSGPLPAAVEQAIRDHDLNVASILSGNRNFQARIHQAVRSNFLASPPLVVAFALAGRIDIDFETEPLGNTQDGQDVFLKDIWPADELVAHTVVNALDSEFFENQYSKIWEGDPTWDQLQGGEGLTFPWNAESTYIQHPPFVKNVPPENERLANIDGARALLVLGDTVTTDHISPAGQYLQQLGVKPDEFNSYGSRRGNHNVMMRGTFANVRIRNRLVEPKEGGYTLKLPDNTEMAVFDAAQAYAQEKTPLIVLAGTEYGTGSSRDWAAKGTALLGVRAVIAKSYERIHRNNLLGMGVLPLQFLPGEGIDELQLTGRETFSIHGIDSLEPAGTLTVSVTPDDGSTRQFNVRVRLDSDSELTVFNAGGILPFVLNKLG